MSTFVVSNVVGREETRFCSFILGSCILALLASRVFGAVTRTRTNGLPLPPGPTPLPLIGNALNMPMKEPWKTFARWSVEYGEIVHVSVFNKSIIILNSPKAVNDLFERKSAIYSDRPRLPLVAEMTGFLEWNFSLMPYNDTWRKYRRIFSSKFGPGTVQVFDTAHDLTSLKLLKLLLDEPEKFQDHIRLYVLQDVMLSTYGMIPKTRDDEYAVLAERAQASVSELLRPGVFLVDVFPFLKHVPSWVPGASTQKLAHQMASDAEWLRIMLFQASKSMMSSGTLEMPCFVSELLGNGVSKEESADPEMERVITDCAMQVYAAGLDTAVAELTAFILAMTLYPAVQKKAQDEIDKVIGTSRLPTFNDRKELPYVTAIMKEVIRWHVAVPQGLPHSLKEADVYEGYQLPKGSIVIGNSWGILHDEKLYPDPMEFKPERFFDSDGRLNFSRNDPAKFAFGYGRRVCPGSSFAENALHLVIARILATFDISRGKDERGYVIPVNYQPLSGFVSHPNAFECAITPRSEEAAILVQQSNENIS